MTFNPGLVALANGQTLVLSSDGAGLGDSDGAAVVGQLFDGDVAAGPAFLINSETAGDQSEAAYAPLADGGFIVVWQDASGTLGDSEGTSIKAQVFAADGSRVGSEFLVNGGAGGSQVLPHVSGLANGGFVVGWTELGDSGSPVAIMARVFDADGAVGGDIVVDGAASFGPASVSHPTPEASLCGLVGGGFAVAWIDDASTLVRVQVFDDLGEAVGPEQIVAGATTGTRYFHTEVVATGNGGFAVFWDTLTDPKNGSGYGTGQICDATGSRVGGAFHVPSDVFNGPVAHSDAGGGFVVTAAGITEYERLAPVITSFDGLASVSLNVLEKTTRVGTVAAHDPDLGAPFIYSLHGADAALFTIDANGTLRFATAPDITLPRDAGTDNVYNVTVTVSDGLFATDQAFAVTVTAAPERYAPRITSGGGGAQAAASLSENTTAAYTVIAQSISGKPLVYSIAGGSDAGKFTIDATTGALAFRAAPDFETRRDFDGDNVYDVIVQVSDGTLSDTQAVAVTVRDIIGETLIGTARSERFAGGIGNDVFRGRGGADSLFGGADNDLLSGDGGNDVLNGGLGHDTLLGGPGNDVLDGGAGADVLTGALGADVFVFDFRPRTATQADLMTDFDHATGDHIRISRAAFGGFTHTGALTAAEFHAGPGAHVAATAAERLIYDSTSGKLWYDADGTGAAAATLVATFGAHIHPALAFTDFQIVA